MWTEGEFGLENSVVWRIVRTGGYCGLEESVNGRVENGLEESLNWMIVWTGGLIMD